MGTVTTLIAEPDGSPWRQSFTDTLIRLCPALNPDVADEVADAEYRVNKELGPKLAAARWAEREWSVPMRLAGVSRDE